LEKLLIRLRNAGLKVNLAKCKFRATHASYLGYRLSLDGILPGSNKFRAIRDSKTPSKPFELKEDDWVLLKECNFLHKNLKLAETPMGHLRITKVNNNGTALVRGKTAKHDNLVHTNLLVKNNRPKDEEKEKVKENVEN
jgi:hypothetical protein